MRLLPPRRSGCAPRHGPASGVHSEALCSPLGRSATHGPTCFRWARSPEATEATGVPKSQPLGFFLVAFAEHPVQQVPGCSQRGQFGIADAHGQILIDHATLLIELAAHNVVPIVPYEVLEILLRKPAYILSLKEVVIFKELVHLLYGSETFPFKGSLRKEWPHRLTSSLRRSILCVCGTGCCRRPRMGRASMGMCPHGWREIKWGKLALDASRGPSSLSRETGIVGSYRLSSRPRTPLHLGSLMLIELGNLCCSLLLPKKSLLVQPHAYWGTHVRKLWSDGARTGSSSTHGCRSCHSGGGWYPR